MCYHTSFLATLVAPLPFRKTQKVLEYMSALEEVGVSCGARTPEAMELGLDTAAASELYNYILYYAKVCFHTVRDTVVGKTFPTWRSISRESPSSLFYTKPYGCQSMF